MAAARLFLIDQGLITLGGHHAEYNFSIAQAAREQGLDPVLVVNQRYTPVEEADFPIFPIFTYAWHNLRRPQPVGTIDPSASPAPFLFHSELDAALRHFDAGPQDHVFIHSVGFLEAEELIQFFLNEPAEHLPFFHLLLRRDVDEVRGNPHAYQAFIRSIGRLRDLGVSPRGIAFYTDTDELTASYTKETGVEFRTLPIPFRHGLIDAARERVDAKGPPDDPTTRLLYLGDARTEKGYHLLPALARSLMLGDDSDTRAKIVAQSNFNSPDGEPKPRAARNQLMALPSDVVTLHLEPLSPDRYYELLCESDVVLIPYDQACYARRSSGIFTEALAAGKPVVIPAGTSMANALPEGAGVVYEGEADFVRACREATSRLGELTHAARKAASAWREHHSPSRLVRGLVDTANAGRSASPDQRPLVLMILDGESLYYKIGAGETNLSQLRFLQRSGYRVGVLALIHHHIDQPDGEFSMREWIDRCNTATDGLGVGYCWVASYGVAVERESVGLVDDLQRRSTLSMPASLRRFIGVHRPGCIYVNYAQNMPAVWKLGVPDIPVVCEAHDIQAFQYAIARKQPVDLNELAREFSLYERMHSVVFVNEAETRRAQEIAPGINALTARPVSYDLPLAPRDLAGPVDVAELLSSCGSELDDVDIESAWRTRSLDQFNRLIKESGIDLLFVGAHHTPNRLALDWFFHQVFVPHLAPRGVNLVIGGTIATQRDDFKHPRVYWTGKVGTLRPLYAAAKVVVLPITEGAGFNMKTMQALGMGKPVVTTSLALRGIGADAAHIAPCDDAEEFARRTLELVRSPAARSQAVAASLTASRAMRDFASHDASRRASLVAALGDRALPLPRPPAIVPHESVEWSDSIKCCNEVIRFLLRRQTVPIALMARFEALAATEHGRCLWMQLADALLVRRDAPILATGQSVFQPLRHWDSFTSAPQALGALCLRAMEPAEFTPPASPEAFAGCQTLAEVLSACGSSRVDVDIDRAWAAQSLEQVQRLEQTQSLDVVAFTDGTNPSMRGLDLFYREVFLKHLAPSGINLTLVGPAKDGQYKHPLVFMAGALNTHWPLSSAARVLVLPFDEGVSYSPRAVRLATPLLATGKPVVGNASAFWHLPPEDAAPLSCDNPPAMARRIRQLLTSPETRRLQAEASMRALHAVRSMLMPFGAETAGLRLELTRSSDHAPIPCEWSPEDAFLGRMVHKSLLRTPVLDAEIKSMRAGMSKATTRARWERSLRCLFDDVSAPIVSSGHTAFAQVGQGLTGRVSTLEQFLGVLEPLLDSSIKPD